jgi:hypothetical protein
MSSQKPLKSILKKPSSPPLKSPSREEHNLQLALHHANLIQAQKDISTYILGTLETLLDYPSSLTTDPAHPDPTDVSTVKRLLAPFQPSDYDDLLEERQIDKKCGYVLCPRPHRIEKTKGRFVFSYQKADGHGNRASADVVEKSEMEKWCSHECARRALWLRVQLSETPAWERTGEDVQLELYGEPEGSGTIVKREEVRELENGMKQLAIERGESSTRVRPNTIADEIKEKTSQGKRPEAPSAQFGSNAHNMIEGYEPKSSRTQDEENDEDIMDTL